jgi:hypothetical protein
LIAYSPPLANFHYNFSMRPDEVAKPIPVTDNYIDGEKMIVEYNSNDMFRDQE